MNRKLFEIEVICNIMSVFTVTFDQCNVYLLNRSTHLYKNKNKINYY